MTVLTRVNRDGVAWLELARPESRNALSMELLLALDRELASIHNEPAIHAVVLSGSGTVFCAGADLKEFGPKPAAERSLARVELIMAVLANVRSLAKPTIAAVNGAAIGAGWGLAMACDLCFTTDQAVYSIPELTKGLRLPEPILQRLIDIVGPMRATDIVFGGGLFTAQQALDWGWATRSFADRDLLTEHTWRFAAELASRPHHSLAAVSHSLRRRSDSEQPSPYSHTRKRTNP
jgi:enoyl-CoA hydratase/carnithine racemase